MNLNDPPTTPALTAKHVAHLRQPFTPESVKWRADAKEPDASGNVRCVLYIDSRLAIERLSEVDPCWQDQYKALAASPGDPLGTRNFAPVMCALTLHGVTRHGIGQLTGTGPRGETPPKEDGKYAKSVMSDSLKRAAVQFGVGSFLYAMPVFKVPKSQCWIKQDGKVGALNKEAITNLRGQYAKIVTHAKFVERFGEAIDYGDVADDERSIAETEAEAEVTDALFDGAHAATQAKGRAVERGGAA